MPPRDGTWYHTIELPDGSTTPGWYDTRPVVDLIPWPASLKGGRCLDVGTFDGFWSFQMERLGASEVVAIDVDDPEQLDFVFDMKERGPELIREWGTGRGPGFVKAKEALGSSVIRKSRSVYDLDPAQDGEFDVVFCGSILLHLRDPSRALESIRSVCRGQLVLVEAIDPTLEIIAPRYSAATFHPYPDQWWLLNSAGMDKLVRMSGFNITHRGPRLLIEYGPGGPRPSDQSWLTGIAARKPGRKGVLHRIWLAEPRPPQPET